MCSTCRGTSIKKPKTRRTTVILAEKDREYLDQLIKKGLEQGVKPFLSKMIDVYREMSIYDWKYPGEYYCGLSRVALFSRENLGISSNAYQKVNAEESGRKWADQQLYRSEPA